MPMPSRLTPEKQIEVCHLYTSGKTGYELAAQFDVNYGTIYNYLHKHGVPVRSTHKLSLQQEEEICRRYRDGESGTTIAKEMGLSSIYKCLERHGIERRPSGGPYGQLYTLNESVFDTVNEQSAYWVGFLMADGCVLQHGSTRQAYIKLELHVKDECHVQAFRDFLCATHPLHYRDDQYAQSVSICVSSDHLAARLADFGVVPSKSHITKTRGGLEHNRHFWRGVVDGDGCLTWKQEHKYPILHLCGSSSLVTQFRDFILANKIDTGASVCPYRSIYRLAVNGVAAAQVASLLYFNCKVALPRKLRKAQEFVTRYF